MRKTVQVGMWLVVMASAFAGSPILAQEGPPAEAPGRVESDPHLVAASKAWHDAWRTNVEAHLRAVAARGTPRDLLVAGWLWPTEDDEARIQANGSLWRRQARDWIQSAYDRSTGNDPLVDWALLNACVKTGAQCDRARLLQRLMAADPGNAEPLLTAHYDAVGRKDMAAAEQYWQASADATHYRAYFNEVGLLMAATLRQVPAPSLEPALAAAIGEDVGLGRPATPKDLADMAVIAINAAIAMPSLAPITQRCRPGIGGPSFDTPAACVRIYRLLAADTSLLITSAIALPQLVQGADTDVERAQARERLRRFAWVYEGFMHLYQRPAGKRLLPEDYADVFLREGEFAAMRYMLQQNGIEAEPPGDWLPNRSDYRALLTAGPAAQ